MTKYEDLIKSLKQGKIFPLYLFFGEEEFLIQEAIDLIISKAVDPGARDFNFNTVYCKGSSGNEIVNLAQTFPFMSERRLVIAKEIEALKAADLDELISYLGSPSPTTCLLMIANQPRYDKKSVIAPVEANGAVVRFYSILDRDVLSWIDNWARQHGLSIHRDAAQYVWQILGNDLQAITNELQKVTIYIKDRKNITFDDVKVVVGDFRDYTPFDLADALGKKNREKAFLILSRLIQEGEQPVGILASIAWNFRRLMRAKAMEAAGSGYDEIKKKMNVIFHQSASFQEQMRGYTLKELQGVFDVLITADRAIKSSGIGGRLVLERMILRLCGSNSR
jgi:DNA polymerase III subunit delta